MDDLIEAILRSILLIINGLVSWRFDGQMVARAFSGVHQKFDSRCRIQGGEYPLTPKTRSDDKVAKQYRALL